LKEYKVSRITYLGYKQKKILIAENHYKMILFENFREYCIEKRKIRNIEIILDIQNREKRK
jgi:hypothetical protein